MKKVLSIILAVVMVLSLVAPFRAPTAKAAVSGLRTASSDTGLPTYTMGELITGKTNQAAGTTVYLKDATPAVVDQYTVGADKNFVLRTSAATKEGIYTIDDGASTTNVYIKYNIANVTPASAPTVGSTVLVSGRLYLGDTAQTPVVDGTTVILAYEDPVGTWNVVTSGTTLNGQFNFYATFANAKRYALFVNDGYAPDGAAAGSAIYYQWVVGPTSITVTNVIDPTFLYADSSTQYAYVRLTDANGAPISGATISFVSGVGALGGVVSMADGVYELALSSGTAGIINLKATTSTAVGNFSLYFQPVSSMWNPRVRLTGLVTGFAINGQVSFAAEYGVGSAYKIANTGLQYTTLAGPVYGAGEFTETAPGFATFGLKPITSGGQIVITLKAMLWTPNSATALTAQPQEVSQTFKVWPTITGDTVTVSPTSVTVGDTVDITVTVKTSTGIERNNARVTLDSGVAGTFTVPTGANYSTPDSGASVVMDAINNNLNIVGGVYKFTGLKINKTGNITVKVEYGPAGGPYVTSYFGLNLIKINSKYVTLTADVQHFVAGQIYPTVKVSGGVAGLTFTASPSTLSFSTIDNGDGTYVFNIQGVPDVSSVSFTATDPSDPNLKYKLTVPVVKPVLTFLSVHKDGLITDSFAETVVFKVTDPDTGAYMTPTVIDLVEQYNAWAVTGANNLQLTQGTNTSYSIGLTSNSLVANWTTGNPFVDYSVDKPYVSVYVRINGQDIYFADSLLVTSPSVKFDVQGRDPIQLYVGQVNTITATALDAHGQPLVNARVGIAGDVTGSWSGPPTYTGVLAGGITGSDGKVVFTFTPSYIGNYKLMLAPSTGSTVLASKYVASVQAPADTTAPTIEITAPANGATVTTSTVTVTGKVTDNVGVAAVYLNDVTSIALKPDGTFAAVVTLSQGANTIKVTAFDAAGNKAEKSITVTYAVPQVTKIILKIGSDIMTVNGRVVQLDAAPEIKNGRTFLPLRAIAEAFGAQVNWVPETQGITVVLGNNQIGLQVGNNTAVVNGNVLSIEPPYIKNGRTMVPVRVIAEGLGAQVEWDPVNYIVTITMQG